MTQYPGQDTDFYVVLNEVVTGPITGLVDLAAYNITPVTPVWYDGLDDWKPAMLAPLTSQLFDPQSEYHRFVAQSKAQGAIPAADEPPQIPEQTPAPISEEPQPVLNNAYAAAGSVAEGQVRKPTTYMVWSVVVAILFNTLCGIIAIVYSWKVSSKFRQGNMASAKKCSECAQWWIAISICVGLITIMFQLAVGSLPGL